MADKDYTDEHEYMNRDAARGIGGVSVTQTDSSGYDMNTRTGPREREFVEKESVQARAYAKRGRRGQEDANDFSESSLAEDIGESARHEAVEQIREAVTQTAIKRMAIKGTAATKLKKLSGFARWGGLGVVWTAYLWQLLFGVFSLIGFSLHAYTLYLKEDTLVGKVVGFVVGFFVDIEMYLPGVYLGIGFWGLSMLIAFGVFIGFLIWFYLTGIEVFHSVISTTVTMVAFSLSIIPIVNLFPWLPLWVMYMNTSSLFTST
jgi:hypothetical protein